MAEPKIPVKQQPRELSKRTYNQPHLPFMSQQLRQMMENPPADPSAISGRGSGEPAGLPRMEVESFMEDARAAKIGIRQISPGKFALYLRDTGKVLWVSSSAEGAIEQYNRLVSVGGEGGRYKTPPIEGG